MRGAKRAPQPLTSHPKLPPTFTLRAFNPAAYGGRAGWRLLQATQPGRLLELRVSTGAGGTQLHTRNVRRFLAPAAALLSPVVTAVTAVTIDGSPLPPAVLEAAEAANRTAAGQLQLCRLTAAREWSSCPDETGEIDETGESWGATERKLETLGPLRQALH